MLKNYLKTAFRNLIKQRFYTLINIIGLAVGIAACLLIVLYVQQELSYDTYHSKSDRIYRVLADIKFNTDAFKGSVTPAPLRDAMIQDFPEVETAMRFRSIGDFLVRKKDQKADNIREQDLVYVDQEIFEVFDIPVISGDQSTALTELNSIVISQSVAKKYFPEMEDPVGQFLTFNNEWDVKITAIIEDFPENSHFNYDFLITMESRSEAKQSVWVSHNFHTYFVLAEGSDWKELEAKFPAMVEKYVGPQVKQFLNLDMEKFTEAGNRIHYYLQPLKDVHLKSDLSFDLTTAGDITYIYIFSAVAIFILLLACINFMNLSTARSANRAREVGVRKVLGSHRGSLMTQFLIESILLSSIAFVLAIFLAEIILPAFNQIADKSLSIPYLNGGFLLSVFAGALVIGFLAGIYPAFFLSGFMPVDVLKGKMSGGTKNGWIRSSLVVFQFATSIILIISTIIVYQQMHFIQNKNLGFNKDQVIVLHETWVLKDQIYTFKEELLNRPEITHASVSAFLPVDGSERNNTVFWQEGRQQNQEDQILMQNWTVDHDFVKTMGMEIVEGRDFSTAFPTDSQGLILNEQAVKNFGLEDPIGKRISTFTDFPDDGPPQSSTFTVVGVVKDFHYESLKNEISGLCLMIGRSTGSIVIRTQTEQVGPTLEILKEKWGEYAQGQPFDYSFLDERFTEMYASTLKIRDIFGIFAMLAIFVACLGLFALASFMAEQRNKEIGIRKVLGATVTDIILLLSKNFAFLVMIALLVSVPIAWAGMNWWLNDFQYHVNIQPWVFLLAGSLALVIAIVTVSSQSFKAALTNPVESLRDE